jgi:hypothetical protein
MYHFYLISFFTFFPHYIVGTYFSLFLVTVIVSLVHRAIYRVVTIYYNNCQSNKIINHQFRFSQTTS